MERIKILILICFYQQVSFGQTNIIIENENLENLNLKGKVKTIKESSFKAQKINNEIVKSVKGWQYDWQKDKEFYFDTIGNLILRKDLSDFKATDSYSIKYDNKNRIIELNRLYQSYFYVYDTLNRIISSKKINKQPGTISSGNEKPATGILTTLNYFYDSKNLLIKKEEHKDNSKIAIETFKYDTLNNLIFSEFKQGAFLETHTYHYDQNNLLIKDEWADNEEGIIEITTFEYNKGSKILEHWVDYEEGKPDGYVDDKFENGLIIETTDVDYTDGSIIGTEFCKYKFDTKGNWIKKTINIDGKYYIVERNIEYY